jgi:hypothetical protein
MEVYTLGLNHSNQQDAWASMEDVSLPAAHQDIYALWLNKQRT